MACGCKFSFHLNGDNLHLILTGELNDDSADKLLQILKTNCWVANKIFVHTDQLHGVDALDRDKFNNTVSFLNNKNGRFIFTGGKAQQLVDDLGLNPYLVKP
jgi:hypothetical protein